MNLHRYIHRFHLLSALLLSITVAGTSAAPVMAAGTNTSVPTIPAEESDSSKADKLFTAVKGDYIQLFKDALFDVKYNKYWNDDAAAVVGGSAVAEAVKTLKASVGSTTYGDKADPNTFYCGFINDVKERTLKLQVSILRKPKNSMRR